MSAVLERWKEILVAIGGILVVLLQIINTLTNQDMERKLIENREKLVTILDQDHQVLQTVRQTKPTPTPAPTPQ